jgi:hypothetical protein
MKLPRRNFLHLAAGAAALPVVSRIARAQAYPSRPVRIALSEAHLRRLLTKYAAYYNESRIHRSLDKDSPFHRAIERLGVIASQPVLGGLHHQYCRILRVL